MDRYNECGRVNDYKIDERDKGQVHSVQNLGYGGEYGRTWSLLMICSTLPTLKWILAQP